MDRADRPRPSLDQNVCYGFTTERARDILADIERAGALREQIRCADIVLKLRPVDQTAALSFGIPLNTTETKSQPVVSVRVALGVDDGAVHRDTAVCRIFEGGTEGTCGSNLWPSRRGLVFLGSGTVGRAGRPRSSSSIANDGFFRVAIFSLLEVFGAVPRTHVSHIDKPAGLLSAN